MGKTPATLEGIAGACDLLLLSTGQALASLPAPAATGINEEGYTLRDAHAYANQNGLTIHMNESGTQVSFVRQSPFGFGPQVLAIVPLKE